MAEDSGRMWAGLPDRENRPESVLDPLGETLTLQSLPRPDTKRWTARRKAAVVAAVDGNLLTAAEACVLYDLTLEEFASWQRSAERHGIPGLRTTCFQRYREAERQKRRPNSPEGRPL